MAIIESNSQYSIPSLYPDHEDVQANGFAWSNEYGIMLQSSKYTVITNSNGEKWLGTQP